LFNPENAVFHPIFFLKFIPHTSIASRIGRIDSLNSVRAYSTLGGTSGVYGTGDKTLTRSNFITSKHKNGQLAEYF